MKSRDHPKCYIMGRIEISAFTKLLNLFLALFFLVFMHACEGSESKSADSSSKDIGEIISKCPKNYTLIPGETLLETSDFCVMQFEAKNAGAATETKDDDVPVSKAEGLPWLNHLPRDAQAACEV